MTLDANARGRLDGKTVIASVSGGKDSAAMSLWLTEQGIEHQRVFMDTGWESDVTYEYIRGPLTKKFGPILWLRPPRQMQELVMHKAMFPARLRRFCTEELKVKPLHLLLETLCAAGADIVNAVGVRAGESKARSKLPEWDGYRSRRGSWLTWRPLIEWSTEDVVDIHKRHGLEPNPLYLRGASRVGCWPCIFARKKEIRLIADTDPGRIDLIRRLEDRVAAEAKRRNHKIDNPPSFFHRPTRQRDGSRPWTPIDEVVEWSRTSRGGRQMELIPDEGEQGCMAWGLCESHDPKAEGWE